MLNQTVLANFCVFQVLKNTLFTSGDYGMAGWIKSEDFKSRNVGFAMDEGIANAGDEMRVFYSERTSLCECNVTFP